MRSVKRKHMLYCQKVLQPIYPRALCRDVDKQIAC